MATGKSGSQAQTTTQKSEPWDAQQPYLKEIFGKAQDNYNSSNPSYYPGQTLAGQGANTLGAQQGALDAASGGQGLIDSSQGVAGATLRGDYLSPDSNPFLKATFDKAAGNVADIYQRATAPGTDAAAISAGRYNPAGALGFQRDTNQRQLGDNLNNLATSIYGGNYQAERGRQQDTMNNAGSIFGQGLLPSQTMGAVGAAQDARSQDVINADIEKFNYNQNLPNQKLADYMRMIQGNYGGSSTTTQPMYSNGSAGTLGGLLSAGGAMGSMGSKTGGGSLGSKTGGARGSGP